MPRLGAKHPSDEALLALAAGDEPESRSLRGHLLHCAACRMRLAQARRVRAMLRDAATYEDTPERDLAFGAVRRLSRRQTSISHVNEFFGALYAIVRGFRTLLSPDERPPAGPRNG